jgi:hypothetical protein
MRKSLLALIVFTSFINFSCEKDCPSPAYPIEGLWIGTYYYTPGTTAPQTQQYFSFIIKPQGALIVESQDAGINYTATGTWTLTGNTLNCRYTYSTSVLGTRLNQSATASFDNSGELSNGVWNNTNVNWEKISDKNQQGTFILHRVN